MGAMAHDKRKQTGAHFTPKALADLVASRLARQLSRFDGSIRILDPACGDGNLLVSMAEAMPKPERGRCTLVGIEDDLDSFQTLTDRLASIADCPPAELKRGDFLDYFDDGTMFSSSLELEPVDVIIANPPYVRTQVLGAGRAQQLAMKFGLEGRVDLYQAFLVAMTEALRPGGILGVITSNRFLTTKAGASTRRFLRREFDLLEVVDLGDTKLFDAAVLPALIFGVRREVPRDISEPSTTSFIRVYASTSNENNATTVPSIPAALVEPKDGRYCVDEIMFDLTTGRLDASGDSTQPWTMHTTSESEWVSALEKNIHCRIKDIAKVRVGIKTTADKVFIRKDWSAVPSDIRPEPRYLRPLLSQRNAARWCPISDDDKQLHVLYTHEIHDSKRQAIQFPDDSSAWRYLLDNRDRLESRKYVINAGRKWYEIWVPQDPAAWELPKVVFPDISPNAQFFFDGGGSTVDGNCYWITTNDPSNEDLLMLILGVANSSTMARYHELCYQNRLYAQRRRYLTQYVQQYPLPDPQLPESQKIINLVRRLTTSTDVDIVAKESEIDQLVARAFGIATSVMCSLG